MIIEREVDIEPDMIRSIATPADRQKLVEEKKKFGCNIYFDDLGKKDLVKWLREERTLDDIRKYKRGQPIAKLGKPVTEKILERIYESGRHSSILVLLSDEELIEIRKKNVTPKVAPYHYANMVTRTYKSIHERFIRLGIEKKRNLERLVKNYKSEMSEDFSIISPDWKIINENFVKGVFEHYDELSLIQIKDKLYREHGLKGQSLKDLEESILPLLLGKKVGLSDEQLSIISLAGLVKNIGKVLYSIKIEGPLDISDEVLNYLKDTNIPDSETIISKMKEDPAFFLSFLRDKLNDFAEEHYGKAKNFNYLHFVHKNIPLYSLILLTDGAGNPVKPLTKEHLFTIYEHVFNENGTLDDSLSNIMYDSSLEREIKKVFNLMDINKDTRFVGEDYKKGPNTKELEETSKVLHITSKYFHLLDKAIKEGVKDPYQKTINIMHEEVKKKKIDSSYFGNFFTYLIPQKYYPDSLELRISEENSLPVLKARAGCFATLKTCKDKQYLVVYTDKAGRKIAREEVKVIPMSDLIEKGHRLILTVGDWKKYHKNGFKIK